MDVKCLWHDCESTKILSRGLCQRDYARARRSGALAKFVTPERSCNFCDTMFQTGSRGYTFFCSRSCQLLMVEAMRIADRWEAIEGRACEKCSGPIPDSARDDARHCSIDCQQGSWYGENADRLRAAARLWARSNQERCREYRHRRRARKAGVASERVDLTAVWERDRGLCWLCSGVIDPALVFPDSGSPSLDHKMPLARGGPHTYANVAMAHLGCNLRKGAKIVAGAVAKSQ